MDWRGENSNTLASEESLSALFETFSDWEQQLRDLPDEHLRLISSDMEEPKP